jgi:hypothetical protein
VRIRRMRCKACGGTVSILPEFLHPFVTCSRGLQAAGSGVSDSRRCTAGRAWRPRNSNTHRDGYVLSNPRAPRTLAVMELTDEHTTAATRDVELSTIDLRYEDCRLRDAQAESELLADITMRGIDRPLCGVASRPRWILLDGFKRYRCARRLAMDAVPCAPVGADEATGILEVLKGPGWKPLGFLEEARFLQELQSVHGMTLAEMAAALGRSKSWASIRLTALAEMSQTVRDRIFRGSFPAHAYTHSVRPFTRVNGVDPTSVDAFVEAVSGRGLSTREIEQLARGYFGGSEEFRREVDVGHATTLLRRIRASSAAAAGGTRRERTCLRELESLSHAVRVLTTHASDPALASPAFRAQAQILLARILEQSDGFLSSLGRFHDRCRAS